ncbi:hypothetical protein SAE02_77800 [Skermanella aerolata]|uniref:Uncharacterized protein n=1 Tax=Skermanella aerolata TaxID=393310 RepID=A0A512E4J2_9PROT|nr:hypothetical protein [Skermanella aerolata]KJB91304.1 hypothetical protein N826_31225 [Skermanella aerolata KACC 11604]GEO43632.1 hypothetical protein SAE02_77800 [Skermanella aerolata]
MTLSSQVDELNLMSECGTYASNENLVAQKKLDLQVLASCGPDALRAILAELPLYISKEHLKLITVIWLRLIDPEVQIGLAPRRSVRYRPFSDKCDFH